MPEKYRSWDLYPFSSSLCHLDQGNQKGPEIRDFLESDMDAIQVARRFFF